MFNITAVDHYFTNKMAELDVNHNRSVNIITIIIITIVINIIIIIVTTTITIQYTSLYPEAS